MSLLHIRTTYGVPAHRFARVSYTGGAQPQLGTVTGAINGHLRIRLDGEKRSKRFHPTWKLTFLPKDMDGAGVAGTPSDQTMADWRSQNPNPTHGCGHMQGRGAA